MSLDPIWFLAIVISILIGVSVAILIFLERTKDKRIKKARNTTSMEPENEAYNKVNSTKSILNVMKRNGKETSEAEVLIERAEMALDSGSYSRASSLAEEAKVKLEKAPQARGQVKSQEKEEKKEFKLKETESLNENGQEELKAKREELIEQREKIQSLPENYLESKFEIKQAEDMLKREGGGIEAENLLRDAQDCFDAEDYTKALKLSIRCKKAINEDEAGLISVKKIGRKEHTEEHSEKEKDEPEEVKGSTRIKRYDEDEKISEAEERVEEEDESKLIKGKPKCPECGYIGEKGDKFCPKCGTELITELACPSCNEEINEEDNFCPKCGYELTETMYECPDCGTDIERDAKFCPNCGIEFE